MLNIGDYNWNESASATCSTRQVWPKQGHSIAMIGLSVSFAANDSPSKLNEDTSPGGRRREEGGERRERGRGRERERGEGRDLILT